MDKTLMRKLLEFVSRKVEFTNELPDTQNNQAKIPSGITPIDSPQFSKYRPMIEQAAKTASEKTGVEVPPYLLAATFHQESSAGTNKANYNPKIGEQAWLMGMTDTAKKDLEKKYKIDLNTEQGVFDASALYYADRAKEYSYDPKTNIKTPIKDYTSNQSDWYVSRYHAFPSGEDYDKIKSTFSDKLNYYKDNF